MISLRINFIEEINSKKFRDHFLIYFSEAMLLKTAML